jgi:YbbR domain-containing protein
VRLVNHATADINLTGLRVTLRQSYPLVPHDARGARVSGVVLEPATSDIRVPINELQITRAVTVVPPVQGVVADGYNLVAMSVDPPAIAISGPLEVLQAIPFISTEAIDVTGLRQDAVRTVRLVLPAGVQSARDTVAVRLRVAPAQGEITIAVSPQVSNVPEGLRPVLQTPVVSIRLSGELPTLRSLTSANVRATVNMNGLNEGVHVLTPTVTAPESVKVVGIEPGQVTVSLQR